MRWNQLLPAILVTAAAATAAANDRVVKATIFDELTPRCASNSVQPCSACDMGGCPSAGCDSCRGGHKSRKGCPGCNNGNGSGEPCGAASLRGEGSCNVCNMPQHYPYPAADHGHYYFRPYNYHRIRDQQEAVTRWGGDPRNPYSNEVFKAIYAEMEQTAPFEFEPVPAQVPDPDGVVPMPAPAAPPSPIIDPAASRPTKNNELRLTYLR